MAHQVVVTGRRVACLLAGGGACAAAGSSPSQRWMPGCRARVPSPQVPSFFRAAAHILIAVAKVTLHSQHPRLPILGAEYMAPEVLQHSRKGADRTKGYGPECDLWSAGARHVLLCCVCGRGGG